jgi:phage gp46-like protein
MMRISEKAATFLIRLVTSKLEMPRGWWNNTGPKAV